MMTPFPVLSFPRMRTSFLARNVSSVAGSNVAGITHTPSRWTPARSGGPRIATLAGQCRSTQTPRIVAPDTRLEFRPFRIFTPPVRDHLARRHVPYSAVTDRMLQECLQRPDTVREPDRVRMQ